MIIPHLAVFNVMITLGELARLCNCGLVLNELRNLAQKKTPHQFRLLDVLNRNQVAPLLPKLPAACRCGSRLSVCQLPDVWLFAAAAFRVAPDVWIDPQLLQ